MYNHRGMKKAAFLDVDGTLHVDFMTPNFVYVMHKHGLISQETLDAFHTLLNHERRHTQYPEWAAELIATMNNIFSGHSKQELQPYVDLYKPTLQKNLYPFAIPLVSLLQQQGYTAFLVTAAHDFIAEVAGAVLKIASDNIIAVKLQEADGKLTNQYVPGNKMNGEDKKAKILALSTSYDLERSVAMGDSESDLTMMQLVRKGFLLIDNKTSQGLRTKATNLGAALIEKSDSVETILTTVTQQLPDSLH